MNTSDSSSPIGIRLGTIVAVSLAAVFLTAGCGSSKSSKTASADNPVATTTATAAGSSSSSGTVDGGASPSAAGSAGSVSAPSASGPGKPTTAGSGGPKDCSTDMLSLSVAPVREPINHVLISAKNTSQLPCHLNLYPELRLDPSQSTIITPLDTTKPAKPILLAPGDTAYAGLMTSAADGSGKNPKTIRSLAVTLESSSPGGGGVGRPATVSMPAGANVVDSSAFVTYWQSDMQTAISS